MNIYKEQNEYSENSRISQWFLTFNYVKEQNGREYSPEKALDAMREDCRKFKDMIEK